MKYVQDPPTPDSAVERAKGTMTGDERFVRLIVAKCCWWRRKKRSGVKAKTDSSKAVASVSVVETVNSVQVGHDQLERHRPVSDASWAPEHATFASGQPQVHVAGAVVQQGLHAQQQRRGPTFRASPSASVRHSQSHRVSLGSTALPQRDASAGPSTRPVSGSSKINGNPGKQRESLSTPSPGPSTRPTSGLSGTSFAASQRRNSVDAVLHAYTRGFADGKKYARQGRPDSGLSFLANGQPAPVEMQKTLTRAHSMSGTPAKSAARIAEDQQLERRAVQSGWDRAWKAMKVEGWTKGCVYCNKALRRSGGRWQ